MFQMVLNYCYIVCNKTSFRKVVCESLKIAFEDLFPTVIVHARRPVYIMTT